MSTAVKIKVVFKYGLNMISVCQLTVLYIAVKINVWFTSLFSKMYYSTKSLPLSRMLCLAGRKSSRTSGHPSKRAL